MRSIHAYLMLAGLCVALPVRAHETPAHAIPQPVEPHVVAARDAALARFPARLRDRLADVPVLRQPAMIAPDDAPLIRQLMVAAAQAAYSNGTQSITVYDAGATRRQIGRASCRERV